MTHTLTEILSQPLAWQSALREAERTQTAVRALFEKQTPLVFTGCGSTWYLAEIAASLFRRITGRMTVAIPGGELLLYPQDWLGNLSATFPGAALIAISRSGTTTETVQAVQSWRANGGEVLAVTNSPDSPLAHLADAALLLPAGREESVAQTRSFASMLVGLNALAVLLAGEASVWQAMQRLPQVGERLIHEYRPLAQALGEDLSLERFYFLGSGVRYGLAREASLKMKEMSLSHSEPFPFLEFRHGPMSMVDKNTLILGLLSEANHSHEERVLEEMRALGGRSLSLGDMGAEVSFQSEIPEEGRLALFLPVLQLIAAYRSLSKGLNPDRPHNLTAVVTLNLFPNQEA